MGEYTPVIISALARSPPTPAGSCLVSYQPHAGGRACLYCTCNAYSIPPPAPGEGDPQLHRDDAGVLAAVAVVRVRVGGRVAAVVPTAGPAPSRRRRRDFVIAAPIIRTLREIHRRDRLHHQLEHDPARKRAR